MGEHEHGGVIINPEMQCASNVLSRTISVSESEATRNALVGILTDADLCDVVD